MTAYRCPAMLLVTCLALLMCGCASSQRSSVTTPGAAPDDFSIDLLILADDSPVDSSRPPHLRPSRIILFADGSLHYGTEAPDLAGWVPPRARTLDQQQMAGLWQFLARHGMADADAADEPVNFKLIDPPSAGQVLYALMISGNDRRWSFIQSEPVDGELDHAMSDLVDRLVELSWAARAEQPIRPVPPRYDFGPDPYARYRE